MDIRAIRESVHKQVEELRRAGVPVGEEQLHGLYAKALSQEEDRVRTSVKTLPTSVLGKRSWVQLDRVLEAL